MIARPPTAVAPLFFRLFPAKKHPGRPALPVSDPRIPTVGKTEETSPRPRKTILRAGCGGAQGTLLPQSYSSISSPELDSCPTSSPSLWYKEGVACTIEMCNTHNRPCLIAAVHNRPYQCAAMHNRLGQMCILHNSKSAYCPIAILGTR